ncbi:hypothetical protein EYF80_003065 [Liparis tanakae]|uniref:Uncharacterized protein n=1 Tax=Liparis tanakae TaxID=230148 RepID=A0A4Z2J992_9TELE|nr:hypothetical protein EYF80_003065 [Liparis tanakae]
MPRTCESRVDLKPSPTKTPQLHAADHLNLSTESHIQLLVGVGCSSQSLLHPLSDALHPHLHLAHPLLALSHQLGVLQGAVDHRLHPSQGLQKAVRGHPKPGVSWCDWVSFVRVLVPSTLRAFHQFTTATFLASWI